MEWTFHLLKEIADIVERQPRLEITQIARPYLKWLAWSRRPTASQSATQRFVDDFAERPAGTPRLRLQLGGHIVIEGQGGTHALMLGKRHHDVKLGDGCSTRPQEPLNGCRRDVNLLCCGACFVQPCI